MIGTAVAAAGFASLLAFSITSRHQASGPIGLVFGLLSIPIGIALLWRMAVGIGWWTIAAFIVESFIVGAWAVDYMRRAGGFQGLMNLQPLLGAAALLCAAAAWFL